VQKTEKEKVKQTEDAVAYEAAECRIELYTQHSKLPSSGILVGRSNIVLRIIYALIYNGSLC